MRQVSGRNAPGDFQVAAGRHGISSFYTFLDPSPHFQRHQYFYEMPIRSGLTRIFAFNMRHAMLDRAGIERVIRMEAMVAEPDRDVLLSLCAGVAGSRLVDQFPIRHDGRRRTGPCHRYRCYRSGLAKAAGAGRIGCGPPESQVRPLACAPHGLPCALSPP